MTTSLLLFVALSALALGIYDVVRKHAVRDNSAVDVLLWSSAAGLAAFLIVAGCGGELAQAARTSHLPMMPPLKTLRSLRRPGGGLYWQIDS